MDATLTTVVFVAAFPVAARGCASRMHISPKNFLVQAPLTSLLWRINILNDRNFADLDQIHAMIHLAFTRNDMPPGLIFFGRVPKKFQALSSAGEDRHRAQEMLHSRIMDGTSAECE